MNDLSEGTPCTSGGQRASPAAPSRGGVSGRTGGVLLKEGHGAGPGLLSVCQALSYGHQQAPSGGGGRTGEASAQVGLGNSSLQDCNADGHDASVLSHTIRLRHTKTEP